MLRGMRQDTKKNKKRGQPLTIHTEHGKLTFTRDMDYCSNCGKVFGQNDDHLELDRTHRATKGFIELATYMAQLIPGFDNAAEVLLKLRSIEVSGTQVQIISEEVGKAVFEHQKESAEAAYAKPEVAIPQILEKDKKDAVLYIMPDGSAVNTRIQDEGGSSWREVKLGLTFLDKDMIQRKNGKGIITQKEYVAYLGSVEEFKKYLFESAVRAGYGRVKKVVFIGDGASWIWNMCQELFPDAECILDYYHLKENVYDYAKALYPADEQKSHAWAESMMNHAHEGETDDILKMIKEAPKPIGIKGNVVNLETYITHNRGRINYPEYRKKGYYIGSGMVESGHKIVLQKRMKQAGMRWGISGAQYMATLRAKFESKRWDEVKKIIFGEMAS